MAFTPVTVTKSFIKNPDGTNATGTVEFRLSQTMNQPGVGSIAPTSVKAVLVAGAISVILYATDDPATTTTGTTVTYRVTEKLDGAQTDNEYNIVVPSAGGPTLDLTTVGPIVPITNALSQYALQSALGAYLPKASDVNMNTRGAGTSALAVVGSGTNNFATGFNSLLTNVTGSNNTAVGAYTLVNATAGSNTAVGASALRSLTIGTSNTALGSAALTALTTGTGNIAVGVNALTAATTGGSNVALGAGALQGMLTGSSNIAIGANSQNASTGTPNVSIGDSTLRLNTTGTRNTALGHNSLGANTTGTTNTAVGDNCLGLNVTGIYNTGIGCDALKLSTGNNNTGLGIDALAGLTTGNNNTAVGYLAGGTGTNLSTGSFCTYVGNWSGPTGVNDPTYAMGLGAFANANANGSVAIGTDNAGTGAVSSVVNQITLGTALHTTSVPGAVRINSTGTAGVLERFRVNTPTTIDNQAVVIISPVGTTERCLVLQTLATSGADALSIQSSTGFQHLTFRGWGSSAGILSLFGATGAGAGCGINFSSDGGTKTGLFQFDGSGNLVFRNSSAGGTYFDGAPGGTIFRSSGFAQNLIIDDAGNLFHREGANLYFGTTTGSMIGQTNLQKIGKWGKVPIVQPTTTIAGATFVVGGAGTAISTLSTFGGYTVAQIAQALINAGNLA